MENSVRSIGIISLIVIGFVFLSPLSVNLKQAQAQQQASTGRNNTAAELARDPGDMLVKEKATPSEELKKDPGDLILTGPK